MDETELTHILGEQEDRFTPSTALVWTRQNSPTYLLSRKSDSLIHNLCEKDERELTHIAGEQEELVVGEEEEEESPGPEGVTACLVDPCRDVDAAAAVDGDHDGLRPDVDVGPAEASEVTRDGVEYSHIAV